MEGREVGKAWKRGHCWSPPLRSHWLLMATRERRTLFFVEDDHDPADDLASMCMPVLIGLSGFKNKQQ